MALAGRSRAGLATKNAGRFAISAEQFRVTAENVEQCKRKQTALSQKLVGLWAMIRKVSVISAKNTAAGQEFHRLGV